jgi:energy-coupling factor transporter ATP-binding protein EcfA2
VLAEQPAPRLVLLGDPGSGKSTLTRRWAGVLAALGQPACRADWVEDEELAADELLRVFGRWLLPVRVVLSQWAQRLPDAAPGPAHRQRRRPDRRMLAYLEPHGQPDATTPAKQTHFLAKFVGDDADRAAAARRSRRGDRPGCAAKARCRRSPTLPSPTRTSP